MNNSLGLFLLALCIWREARGESIYGKLLVAQTIKNRVQDPRWPNNYRDVILQPNQFSSFNKLDSNAVQFPNNSDIAWDDSVAAAQFILDGITPITIANHYHAKSVTPSWADKSKIVNIEGNHIFYKL